ncbi:hypothetical protein EJ03DRAFT_365200 [Teratosphaeria nubilosa]|uniref:Myb-like domain-containing protein n=1 Tax=Teratosphaeria nubilosa TaxID=161662 RepID=A0A6G1L4I3_9PEZI|nr:hypothetical protein EJ03DRAFT_365200 [Teratosphaeria nubilosa]
MNMAPFLDLNLLTVVFSTGSIAQLIEHSLDTTIQKHVALATNSASVHETQLIAIQLLQAVISCWRDLLPGRTSQCKQISKFDLGYSAALVSGTGGRSDMGIQSDILKVLTMFFNHDQVKDSMCVSPQGVNEILDAASKVCLGLLETMSEANSALSDAAHAPSPEAQPQASVSARQATLNETEPPLVRTIGQDHPDHDPLFPSFEPGTPGVIGEHSDIEISKTPKKMADTVHRSNEATVGRQSLVLNVKTIDVAHLLEVMDSDRANRCSEKSSPDLSDQKLTLDGTRMRSSPDRRTQRRHEIGGKSVPWHEDEEEFVAGLIVICRHHATWQEYADAANAYFADKPIVNEGTGEVLYNRGRRTAESIRQKFLAFLNKTDADVWWQRLDAQTNSTEPAVMIDWRAFREEVARGDGKIASCYA